MTIDKQKLKALAEAATQSHGARQVEIDHNGVHVIGEGSWKILSAWHTPDGKGAQNAEFVAAASPATVLTLLAEIDGLHDQHGRDSGELRKICNARDSARRERDQLKAENEALRKALLEASEEVATWGAYASEYFQEKHDLAGCVAKLHAAAMAKEADQ